MKTKMLRALLMKRDCVLWGKKRHIFEFAFMFDWVNYLCYCTADGDMVESLSICKKVDTIEQISNPRAFYIICDLVRDEYERYAQKAQWVYGQDYIYFEDLFALLDDFSQELLAGRKIAVWGIGETEKNFQKFCTENSYNLRISCYVDNNTKDKRCYNNLPLYNIVELDNPKDYFFIIASIYYREIRDQLAAIGLIERVDFLPFSYFATHPSSMMKQIVRAESMEDFYCDRPYTWFYYAWFGVYPCCSTWVKYPIGNPAANEPIECWNSVIAKLYRLSAETRTYCFCNNESCPMLGKKHADSHISEYSVPKKITLGLDYTCNLYCTSCRDHICVSSGKQLEIRKEFARNLIATGWLEKCDEVELSGSGEALFSAIDRQLLFSDDVMKRKSLSLMTNGLLLDENTLQKLKENYNKIKINISIDAATPETYAKIRRGGNWERLMHNLAIISNSRLQNEIQYVEFRMVVQRENYREIPQFIQMAKRFYADKVVFTKLLNWDMFTEEEYQKEAMFTQNGELEEELKEILLRNEMKDPIVVVSEFQKYLC